jgi:sugar lactone lactonase YvrE
VLLCALFSLVAAVVLFDQRSPAVEADSFPSIIDLPNGWLPEGVAVGEGPVLYAGSRRHGAVYAADLRTGDGRNVVEPRTDGRIAVGLAFDPRSDFIFVAGGGGGAGYVYNAETGDDVAAPYQFVTPMPGTTTFVNDVDVARDAAYFTDSARPVIYKVPLGLEGELGTSFEEIPLPPDFNLNGIVATPDGKTLIGVQAGMGVRELLRVDVESRTSSVIDLDGYDVAQGDGLLLEGKTIFVMRNRINTIAVIELSPDFSSGVLQREITDPNFDVPTTIDRLGNRLYLVQARFGVENPGSASYWVEQVAAN